MPNIDSEILYMSQRLSELGNFKQQHNEILMHKIN